MSADTIATVLFILCMLVDIVYHYCHYCDLFVIIRSVNIKLMIAEAVLLTCLRLSSTNICQFFE